MGSVSVTSEHEKTPVRRVQYAAAVPGLFRVKVAATGAEWHLVLQPTQACIDEASTVRVVASSRRRERKNRFQSNLQIHGCVLEEVGVADHLVARRGAVHAEPGTCETPDDRAKTGPTRMTVERVPTRRHRSVRRGGNARMPRAGIAEQTRGPRQESNTPPCTQLLPFREGTVRATDAGGIGRAEQTGDTSSARSAQSVRAARDLRRPGRRDASPRTARRPRAARPCRPRSQDLSVVHVLAPLDPDLVPLALGGGGGGDRAVDAHAGPPVRVPLGAGGGVQKLGAVCRHGALGGHHGNFQGQVDEVRAPARARTVDAPQVAGPEPRRPLGGRGHGGDRRGLAGHGPGVHVAAQGGIGVGGAETRARGEARPWTARDGDARAVALREVGAGRPPRVPGKAVVPVADLDGEAVP